MKLFKTDVLDKKRQALAVFDQAKEGLQEFLNEAESEISSKQQTISKLQQEIAEEEANVDALDSEMQHAEQVISNIEKIVQ